MLESVLHLFRLFLFRPERRGCHERIGPKDRSGDCRQECYPWRHRRRGRFEEYRDVFLRRRRVWAASWSCCWCQHEGRLEAPLVGCFVDCDWLIALAEIAQLGVSRVWAGRESGVARLLLRMLGAVFKFGGRQRGTRETRRMEVTVEKSDVEPPLDM